jgi:hypothetical protein
MVIATHVYDGSVYRQAGRLYIYDGTAWRNCTEAHVYDGTAWRQHFTRVNIGGDFTGTQSYTDTNIVGFGWGYHTLTFQSNGQWLDDPDLVANSTGDWSADVPNTVGAQFELYWTEVSTSPGYLVDYGCDRAENTWLSMGSSTQFYVRDSFQDSGTTHDFRFDITIRRTGDASTEVGPHEFRISQHANNP